jgi:phosphatidylinositol kinase/protein kinase (PI-3  family)
MPFSTTTRAIKLRVRKQFTSKAKPFWVQLQSPGAEKPLDVVMKTGDDLRQDQAVLSMLEVFNKIWEDTGVMHTAVGNDRVLVKAPTYRVAAVGNSHGFVEMLPDSLPCDEIVEKASRSENGWKASPEIIPSSVSAFIVIFVLNIKDRHKGNMVVTGGTQLANIDLYVCFVVPCEFPFNHVT